MFLGWVPFTFMSDSSALHSRWMLLLKIEISSIVHCCFIMNIPARFGLIWVSGFRRKDLNVIFYKNMPNLHNRYKSVERKISQTNPEYMLNNSFWTKLNQTWQGWSLGGSLFKFKMDVVTKNKNFFNCPLLHYYKSKWAQIFTAATWKWVV
jgi:hypothetical protein